jgi:fructose-1,6-bisphosphatase/inositol monophosphatase family enzyme
MLNTSEWPPPTRGKNTSKILREIDRCNEKGAIDLVTEADLESEKAIIGHNP